MKLCTNLIPLLFGAPKGSRRARGIVVRTETINTETILRQVVGVVQYPSLNCIGSVRLLPQTMEQEMQQPKQRRRMVQSSYPDIVVGYPRNKHKNKIRI